MTNKLQYTPEQEEMIVEDAFQDLLQAYLNSNHRKKVEIIERAYRFAKEAHKGVRRRSGEPYILHPIAVAKIVISELGLGSTSICAALLHDVIEDTEFTREDIAMKFGDKIADIVEGLTKISGGIFGDRASLQAENFKKLLLSMSTDIRVVLIKMADRLHNMRTLGSMRPEKQFKIAGETLYIYAPLAHRLGLYKIKTELEDLALKYEHPNKYAEIVAKVSETEEEREAIVEEFVAPIRKKLDDAGFKYEIKTRVKSAYSIYNKMEHKHVPFEEIYDVYAVRVIFENEDDAMESLRCWQIYTYFSEMHRLHPERLRDWIGTPKPNGYRALHLTAMGPKGKWIEVQIRSRKMDEIAELGYAAHWKYKSNNYEDDTMLDEWMNTIKEILANPEPNSIDYLDTIKLSLYSSEIYVFTPKGDLISLPSGSSVLDLAFAIHSELGMHCIAGKINHKLVPAAHVLGSGDQVEIITSETQTPQLEWLKFCKTAKAQNHLRSYLRKDKKALVSRGKQLFEEFMQKQGVEITNEVITKILGNYHLADREALYIMIANDEISLESTEIKGIKLKKNTLLGKLLRNPFTTKGKKKDSESESKPKINRKEVYVLHPDDNPPNYLLDTCCSPVPGDDVLGFVDDDENVIVHKISCPTAMRLKSAFGSRLVATEWHGKADRFQASIIMEGLDRPGMLQDIAKCLSTKLDINLRALNINTKHDVFHCKMSVMIDTTETIDKIVSELLKIKGITIAKRIS